LLFLNPSCQLDAIRLIKEYLGCKKKQLCKGEGQASKFVYANNIAQVFQHKDIKRAEVAHTNYLETLKEYFIT